MIYILDASAIIAWLRNEPGDDVVDVAIRDVNSYYDARRNKGEAHAETVLDDLDAVGVIERADFDQAFWKEAGGLKAKGGISLPDCFAITLTNRVGGSLLTSDHGEMDKIAAAGGCNITFIR
jgi:PIN domain nuclease of toxin-antitoxin system